MIFAHFDPVQWTTGYHGNHIHEKWFQGKNLIEVVYSYTLIPYMYMLHHTHEIGGEGLVYTHTHQESRGLFIDSFVL